MPEDSRIAYLSLLSTPGEGSGRCNLPQGRIGWDVIPIDADLDLIAKRIPELLASYDAVALEGLTSTFRIGKQRYRHEYIWKALGLEAYGGRVSDGSGLQATLERYLVRQAAEKLKDAITGKRILFFCGLNRYGSAEVLSAYSNRLTFGDLLYGFRLGIPITSFKGLVAAAPQIARAVSQTPAQWFWPSARRSKRVMPPLHRYFRRAQVIVGGISYFQRYAPDSLAGKVIFTNLLRDEDLALFASRGARYVVSLTPVIDGAYVPLPVLEAGLRLNAHDRITEEIEDYYLNQLQELELIPLIHDLGEGEPAKVGQAAAPAGKGSQAGPPEITLPETEQQAGEALDLSEGDEVAKFCFVIHPLTMKHLETFRAARAFSAVVPPRLVEDAAAQLPPMPVGVVRNIVSPSGARAEGVIYAVPMTSKAILRYPPEFLYRKILQVAADAAKRGCKLMGLGAFTSVAGDAGVTVSTKSPIGVTTGNSYTVAATLKTLEMSATRCGIELESCALLVVGATGSIGSICARLLAPKVKELYLVGPKPERLLTLSRQILSEYPSLAGRLKLSRHARDYLPLADIVLTTTSSLGAAVDVSLLRPGCLVCDVAVPPDIKAEEAAARDDILVIEAGEVRLPEGAELTFDFGLPPGIMYACLAETVLLALERRFGHFTLGRDIEPDRVRLIAEIAERHGFELASARSFGVEVPDEAFARLAAINRASRTQATAAHTAP